MPAFNGDPGLIFVWCPNCGERYIAQDGHTCPPPPSKDNTLATCPHCGDWYWLEDGHNCPDIDDDELDDDLTDQSPRKNYNGYNEPYS